MYDYIVFNELGANPTAYIGDIRIEYNTDLSTVHQLNSSIELRGANAYTLDIASDISVYSTDMQGIIINQSNISTEVDVLSTELKGNIEYEFNNFTGLHTVFSTNMYGSSIGDTGNTVHQNLSYEIPILPISYHCNRYLDTPYENRYLETPCN